MIGPTRPYPAQEPRPAPGPLPKEFKRVNTDLLRDPLDRLEREVALSPLQTTHVGPVHPDEISEGFLGELAFLPVATQVPPDRPLQITFHLTLIVTAVLLVGLQTYQ